ncbi:YkuS family protein [Paenibacillus thermotolerans]|uniref:YkuS family protein n=1 Tax=Paenibacillus thermotolerans TaxID=3027807 RepID=UPI002367FEEC|nr:MULTISPECIES: YkuS family protein [unclassified Paenibacillus]
MAKVAVENSLGNIKDALHNSGYEVMDMSGNLEACDCCVISGEDKNMMGMTDRATQASVINAQGMTEDEVIQRVNECVQRVH